MGEKKPEKGTQYFHARFILGSITSEMNGFLTENLYGKQKNEKPPQEAIKLKVKRPSLVGAFQPPIAESSIPCSSNTSSSPSRPPTSNAKLERQGSSVDYDNMTSSSSSDLALNMKPKPDQLVVDIEKNF